ncbi:hypothetical protein AJ80_06461 [Polytolypa hystricis UAMH7299]|uniref:Nuclear speckle splicing regulatory protein 1 N-terminal domain-containing protein n=1 Tax=Polytolypa hystricis (strain UAMH7299) TaxID=1447883 RepID=A0A2B7XVV8_POLH7|nr:hypothetical protein AJ80_06461 [Polytolypa hystricis UAMH7299]
MPPPTLSYGLNLPNKKKPSVLPSLLKSNSAGQKRKKTIFDSDSEDGEDHSKASNNNNNGQAVEITTLGGLSQHSDEPPPAKRKPPPTTKPPPQNTNFTNLSSLHTSKKHAQTAEALDPSIYDYDNIYDTLHAQKNPTTDSSSSSQAVPKYMTSLLRSAEIRKRDQLRARDRLLAREREAEGDEFAEKEKFVTAAYKAQQEEARRLEEEEAEREKEEEERKRKGGGGGMVAFYKSVLERDGRRHEEVVRAVEEVGKKGPLPPPETGEKEKEEGAGKEGEAGEKSAAQVAVELNAQGANIVINEEGQVVDKRQLLSAGLNVAAKPKPKPAPAAASRGWTSESARRPVDVHSAREAQRNRQTDMVATQLEDRLRQEQEEEEARRKELAERVKSQKSGTDIQSAKERYLARKREREKEMTAKKAEKGE